MALPTKQQIQWAKKEVGVLIHYDITVFEPEYRFRKQWGYHPDPKKFAPTHLDTDQWIASAKTVGAKYAILVAKHCTGFCLWPTTPYSVAQSSYDGDIVGEFVASCKKHGLKAGLYYSCACNAYMDVDNPGLVRSSDETKQREYIALMERQIEELWSQYGDLLEIWFDGGLLSADKGGPNLKPLYDKYQPNAVKFQGTTVGLDNNLRWVGNERGYAPFDCWSTTNLDSQFTGTNEDASVGSGSSDGKQWAPAESDAPNRKKQWFWKKGEERRVLPASKLMDMYYHSVGRNSNLLLGMVIDTRGLFPDDDVKAFEEFGKLREKRFSNIIDSTAGTERVLSMKFDTPQRIDHIVLSENLKYGHGVRAFELTACLNGKEKSLYKAQVIGNKRICAIKEVEADEIRLTIIKDTGEFEVTEFSCFYAGDYTFKEKVKAFFTGKVC